MVAKQRVALGAIFTECNQFGGEPIERSWFERYELRRGREVLAAEDGVVGGMLNVLAVREVEVAPLLFASTCPGGPLTRALLRPAQGRAFGAAQRGTSSRWRPPCRCTGPRPWRAALIWKGICWLLSEVSSVTPYLSSPRSIYTLIFPRR